MQAFWSTEEKICPSFGFGFCAYASLRDAGIGKSIRSTGATELVQES
jgi:hypothetical protein